MSNFSAVTLRRKEVPLRQARKLRKDIQNFGIMCIWGVTKRFCLTVFNLFVFRISCFLIAILPRFETSFDIFCRQSLKGTTVFIPRTLYAKNQTCSRVFAWKGTIVLPKSCKRKSTLLVLLSLFHPLFLFHYLLFFYYHFWIFSSLLVNVFILDYHFKIAVFCS